MADDLYDGLGGELSKGNAGPTLGAIRGAPGGGGRLGATGIGRMTTGFRGTTGAAGAGDGPRPMTSVKAAGYVARSGRGPSGSVGSVGGASRPGSGAAASSATLEDKPPSSAEDLAKEMERKVHSLLEASADAAARGDVVMALERAKEAGRRERALVKHRETNGIAEGINADLTYAVCFNLANAYYLNKMYTEALNTYALIVKNKQYPQAGRLRINMGNIHFEEGRFSQAVKMYRMALDQIPAGHQELRNKVQRNIGHAFVRMGQFQDAITSFEAVMDAAPEFSAGFNLVVCYYSLGDVDLMKKGFLRLLQVPLPEPDDEEAHEGATRKHEEDEAEIAAAVDRIDLTRDVLKEELRARQKAALTYVTNAAKLIAPALANDPSLAGGLPGGAAPRSAAAAGGLASSSASSASSAAAAPWVAGYDWVIEQLKRDHCSVASEMQICKALQFMTTKQFDAAIGELKAFEKKDQRLKARAATNLAFLYFVEGDINQATKFANLAVRHDRYNAKALVNMGNCLLERGEMERAKELYLEAIGVEADCVEAIFNLGLVNKQLGVLHEALQAFEKLHALVASAPEVLYQIATLHEALGNYRAAAKFFNLLVAKVPTDPGALARLGQLYAKDEDETQAFHYHGESYKYYPVDLDVISWLGVWYVKSELYERAIEFFSRAGEIQPGEVKWGLMVASCYRRAGALPKALELYESIHAAHPDNVECLRYLVALCKDLNRRHDHYEAKLARLERAVAGAAGRAGSTGGPAYYGAAAGGGGGGGGGGYYGGGGEGDDPYSTGGRALGAVDAGPAYDRFAAPQVGGMPVSPHDGGGSYRRGDDFGDANVGDLLTE